MAGAEALPACTLVDCLCAVHAPATPAAERLRATQHLEAFKQRAHEHLPELLALVAPLRAAQERHFAMHTLVELVRARWPSLAELRRAELKALALQLVGLLGEAAEPAFIAGAAVRLVCELAVREWPQRWPELVDELLRAAERSPRHAALALECMSSLADEVREHTSARLPDARHAELCKSLEAVSAHVAARAHACAADALAHLRACTSAAEAGAEEAAELVRAASRALCAQLLPLPADAINALRLEEIGAALLELPPALAALGGRGVGALGAAGQGDDARASGCELLAALASAKASARAADPADDLALRAADAAVRALGAKSVRASLARPTAPSEYALHKRLAQLFTALGGALLGRYHNHAQLGSAAAVAASARAGALCEALARVVGVLLGLMAHPSLALCAPIHPFWTALLRSEQLAADDARARVREQLPQLLRCALLKLQRARASDAPVHADADAYAALECADEDELADAAARERAAVIGWVGAAVSRAPAICVACGARWAAEAADRAAGACAGSAADDEARSVLAGACALLEAIVRDAQRTPALDALAAAAGHTRGRALPPPSAEESEAAARVAAASAALLRWRPASAAHAALQARALGALVPAWAAGSPAPLLAGVLHALLALCACDGGADARARAAAADARARAAGALGALARCALGELSANGMVPAFLEATLKALLAGGLGGPAGEGGESGVGGGGGGAHDDDGSVERSLLEAYAAASGAAPCAADQRALLSRVAEPLLAALDEAGATESAEAFAIVAGLAPARAGADGWRAVAAAAPARARLVRALRGFAILLRRAPPPAPTDGGAADGGHPLAAHVPRAARAAVRALLCIDRLTCQPELEPASALCPLISPQLLRARVLALTPADRSALLGRAERSAEQRFGAQPGAGGDGGSLRGDGHGGGGGGAGGVHDDASAADAARAWLCAVRREASRLLALAATGSGGALHNDLPSLRAAVELVSFAPFGSLPVLSAAARVAVGRALLVGCATAELAAQVGRALLPHLCAAVARRVDGEFERVRRADGVGDVDGGARAGLPGSAAGSDGEMDTLLDDRLARLLANEALECMHAVLCAQLPGARAAGAAQPQPQPQPAGGGSGGGGGVPPVGAHARALGGLGEALLAQPDSALALVGLLVAAFDWRDATALRHAAGCALCALPALVRCAQLRAAAARLLPPAAARALAWRDAPHGELVGALRELHAALLDTDEEDAPRAALLALPGVTAAALDDAERALRAAGAARHDVDAARARQRAYRALLAPVVAFAGGGGNASDANGGARAAPVTDLDEPLVVRRQGRQPCARGAGDETPGDAAIESAIEAEGAAWLFG
ncbi:hypothetical protein KFE25_010524 [Diacronema lutheri]|uniref:Exportin-1/Importin-beta-like domain-containing protein n=1 Tax=Diacronema lutheri TaxID=2081491 RepID=A0A8J5XCX4_DIALT|nr:hypothetical protein KFE25_010524 [Diacronema lutheri]